MSTHTKWQLFCSGKVTMRICFFWTSHEPESENWEDRQNARETQEPNSAVKAPTVLATCPGTVGSLLGAAFLAVKADHALCHSWGAVLTNCLFSTTLSSIFLLTAPLQLENANKDPFSCQISGNHTAPGTTQCESLWRGCCAKRQYLQAQSQDIYLITSRYTEQLAYASDILIMHGDRSSSVQVPRGSPNTPLLLHFQMSFKWKLPRLPSRNLNCPRTTWHLQGTPKTETDVCRNSKRPTK